jgi:hypothetical protein
MRLTIRLQELALLASTRHGGANTGTPPEARHGQGDEAGAGWSNEMTLLPPHRCLVTFTLWV